MSLLISALGFVLGLAVGAVVVVVIVARKFAAITDSANAESDIRDLIQQHFHPVPVDNITISERRFPLRVRADLQLAINRLFGAGTTVSHFCGVRKEYSHGGVSLADCLAPSSHDPAVRCRRNTRKSTLAKISRFVA